MITQRDRVAALAAEGLPQCDIARRLGVTRQRVSQIVQKHDIECAREPQRKLSDQTKRILYAAPALAERGLSKSEAAREMCVSLDVFTHAVRKRLPDVEWRDGRAQSDEHPTTVRVRELAAEGLTQRDIAGRLGVTQPRVSQIVQEHGIERRDLRKDATGPPLSDQTQRILEAAPALAERGLSKSEAARALGVPPNSIIQAVNRHLPDVEWRDGRTPNRRRGRFGERTQRFIQAVPVLAERGLSKADAARELGVSPAVFMAFLHKRMPDIQWRDGREHSGVTKRIVQSAPALARRGLSKSEAARELGLSPAHLSSILRRHLPNTQWRNGRERAPGTVKDDERSTMRRVMAETLAGAEQPPIRDGGGIGR